MKCIYCGSEIDNDSTFCPNCGHDLSNLRRCPKCGSLLENDAVFCPNCGQNISMSASGESSDDLSKQSEVEASDESIQEFKKHVIKEDAQTPQTSKATCKEENTTSDSEDNNNDSIQGQGKRDHKGLIIFAFVVIVVLFGICVYWFLSSDGNTNAGMTNDSISVVGINLDSTNADDAQKHSIDYLNSRINDIYSNVFQNLSGNYNETYLSTSYNKLLNEISNDSDLVVDDDHWIMSQDFNSPQMQIKSVKISGDTAYVDLIISDSWDDGTTSMQDIRLVLVYEHGDWYVDNFIKMEGGKAVYSERKEIETYISEHQ